MKPRKKPKEGFSLTETLVTATSAAIIAMVALPAFQEMRTGSKAGKLNSEVTSINSVVKAYVASGGEIKETDTALEVLQLLKSEISAEEAINHVGYTGSFVDPRLTGKIIDKDSPGLRAVWDFPGRRFQLTAEPVPGISAFELDDHAPKVTKTRKSVGLYRYNDNSDGWVWKYGEAVAMPRITPTKVTTSPQSETITEPILISLAPKVAAAPEPEPEEPPVVDPNTLQAPLFSASGGTHPLRDYQIPLQFNNPNSDVPSVILYRIGSGDWQAYSEGSVISVLPDTMIDAYVFSGAPEAHPSSTLATSTYRSNPVQIAMSVDSDVTSASYFDLVENERYINWGVANLEQFPEYLKTPGFFATYRTNDSSDPAFSDTRAAGEAFSNEYEMEKLKLSPGLWPAGSDELELTFYAASRDTTWIKSSEKETVTLAITKETLSKPEYSLEDIGNGKFRVTLTPSGKVPPGAQIYYNIDDETMLQNQTTGFVANGTLYTAPFIWEPQSHGNEAITLHNGATGSGSSSSVHVTFNPDGKSVSMTSSKDLSNVVLGFTDGVHYKFDGLSGKSQSFEGIGANADKTIATVWVKSGSYRSGDGPGYGYRFKSPISEPGIIDSKRLAAAVFPPGNLATWFDPKTRFVQTEGNDDDDSNEYDDDDSNGNGNSGNGHSNNGHGNNIDGVDSSNPGQGHGGPNGQVDPSGDVDDEGGNGNSSTGN